MFDPGAMGTLIIGLDDVRRRTEAEARYPISEPLPAGARPTRSMRAGLAHRLRAAADWLQPAGEIGSGTSRA
jgi:hypothetical protein